jgi:hypothetical protein
MLLITGTLMYFLLPETFGYTLEEVSLCFDGPDLDVERAAIDAAYAKAGKGDVSATVRPASEEDEKVPIA